MLIALYFVVQGVRCTNGVNNAREKLKTYDVNTANLSYGEIHYIDEGEGEPYLLCTAYLAGTTKLMMVSKIGCPKIGLLRHLALVTSAHL